MKPFRTTIGKLTAAESAWDQGKFTRVNMWGTEAQVIRNPRMSLQAERYIANTEGIYRCRCSSVGLS